MSRGGSAGPVKDFCLKNPRVTTKCGLLLAVYCISVGRLLYAKSTKAELNIICSINRLELEMEGSTFYL